MKQDFALINWEDAKKEETLSLVTENVLKAGTELQEVVIDTGCTSDLAGRAWWMKFKNGMSAEDQEKVISTEGIKTYKFGAGESVRSMRKVGFHAYVAGNKVNFLVDIPGELPFLLSLKTMRERGFIIDCDQDTVSIRMKSGLVVVPVRVGDNGHHYWLTLEHEGRGRNESCLVVHDWNENKNWKKFLEKLHENFRHPKNWRLKELLVCNH